MPPSLHSLCAQEFTIYTTDSEAGKLAQGGTGGTDTDGSFMKLDHKDAMPSASEAESFVHVTDPEGPEGRPTRRESVSAQSAESATLHQSAPSIPSSGGGSGDRPSAAASEVAGSSGGTSQVRPAPTGWLSWLPSREEEAALFVRDSEEVRERMFEKLRGLVAHLGELDGRLKELGSEATGRAEPLTPGAHSTPLDRSATLSGAGAVDEEQPDWGGEEEAPPEDLLQTMGAMNNDETRRLLELLLEQKDLLENFVREQQAAVELARPAPSDRGQRALQALASGRETEAMCWINSARPDQVAEVDDEIGQTLLHWAVRAPCLRAFFAVLDKAPQLAHKPTKVSKNPAGWTPLMMLTQSKWHDEVLMHKMASSLCNHMNMDSLAHRSGTFSTVLHLAAAAVHWVIIKKVLYRAFELRGQGAVRALLAARNHNVPWLAMSA